MLVEDGMVSKGVVCIMIDSEQGVGGMGEKLEGGDGGEMYLCKSSHSTRILYMRCARISIDFVDSFMRVSPNSVAWSAQLLGAFCKSHLLKKSRTTGV